MKQTISTLHVDSLFLFTTGTKDFCAVAVDVIFTHGPFILLPLQLLQWLPLICYLLHQALL